MAGNKNSGRKSKPNSSRTSIHVSDDVLRVLKEHGWGSISLGVELLAYEKKYGAVVYEGMKYILTGQADTTNRKLSAVNGSGWYDDNDYFEMSAPALDWKGNSVDVYWIFKYKVNGDTPIELDEYDYDKVTLVKSR